MIFRVHSGTSRHGVFYFTSEAYDESKYEPEQFRDELRPGKDYEGNPAVFAFGSNFVDTYLQGRFQNAIIIGMGCFGAGTSYGAGEEVTVQAVETEEGPNLADAFYRQGATAVIGWDSLVTLEFSERATLELIKALAPQQLTVRQATEKVNTDMGADPVYRSELTFYPQQNGDRTLLIRPLQIQTRTEATTVGPLVSSTLMLSLTRAGLLGRFVVALELGPKGVRVPGVVGYRDLRRACKTSQSRRPP